MSDSDDDVPTLSAEAMAALQEFYAEQKEETEVADEKEPSMPQEDWVGLRDCILLVMLLPGLLHTVMI